MSFQGELDEPAPPEPNSSLSVIPEATEENRGSSFFLFKARGSRADGKAECAPLIDTVAGVPTKHSADSRDGEVNEFRAVVLVGKQPYSSCCCRLF